MKGLLRLFVILFGSLALPWQVFAQETPLFCINKEAVVMYGNGVLSEKMDAKHTLQEIKRALNAALPQQEYDALEFDLAYNPTKGVVRDLLEAIIQDLGTDSPQAIWGMLAGDIPMPSFIEDLFLELVAEAAVTVSTTQQRHVDRYKNHILEGKKVLLVAHSQGNFFANLSYSALTSQETQSFGIVSVANPDSRVAGGGPYTPLFEDLVILAVRAAKIVAGLPEPMNPNWSNLSNSDRFGHSFLEAYLERGNSSRTRIVGHIVTTLNGLTPPPPVAQDGIITVTLTWGAEPDVDLHVFEPNGTHVYYANLQGISGYLDVDDVTSYGPEHYYVGCDTLEAGTYRVGVNYYRGSGPETAQVQIEAGNIVRNFSTPLSTAVGSAGNDSPIPVADILVTGTPEQGYSFGTGTSADGSTPQAFIQ